MADVLVIGGGVLGLTSAWELAKCGLQVTLLERGTVGTEASWAGAGMIPPGDRTSPSGHALAAWSAQLWPQLSRELREATGLDNGYRRCGALQFEVPDEESLTSAVDDWRRLGVAVEVVEKSRLKSLAYSLNPAYARAALLPDLAQVRNPWHLQALRQGCAALGVRILEESPVLGWEVRDGRLLAARTPVENFSAGQFVMAAGAWTSELLRELGGTLEIEPVRGQIVLYQADPGLLPLVLEAGRRYLVPREDGRILVGSTEERVGFVKANTETAVTELMEFAVDLVPGLRNVPVERTWSGLRPAAIRGRPWIGPARDYSNLFVAAGHFRSGLSNSPATARLIRQMILGEPASLDVAPFAEQG